MWDMLGLGLKSQAEGEINNLNDTRSELDNWDFGDRFRSAVTGVSREDTQKKARELLEKKINATQSRTRGDITTLAGGFDLGLGDKIREDETYEDYETRLSGEKATATIANQYSLMENSDTSLLKPGMSVGTIRALQGNLRDSNKKTTKAENLTETLRQEGVIADREEAGRTERANIRSDDRAAQRAENKLTRDLGILTNDKDMAIAQMNADLQDKRMDYDRETRRMDKRSAAIAQLMSGLGSLGGAFAL